MPKTTKPTSCIYFACGGIIKQSVNIIGFCNDKFEEECYPELVKKYGDVTTGHIMDASAEVHFEELKEKTKEFRIGGSEICVKSNQNDMKDIMRCIIVGEGDKDDDEYKNKLKKIRVTRYPKKNTGKDDEDSDDEKEKDEVKKDDKKKSPKNNAPAKKAPAKKEAKKEAKKDDKEEKKEDEDDKKKAPKKKVPPKKAPAKKAPAKKESEDEKSEDDKSDDDTTDAESASDDE